MAPTKKRKPESLRKLVVSTNTPKITIHDSATALRIVIPGYHRETVALAHAITSALIDEAGDELWTSMLAPRVDMGDRLASSTVIYIDASVGMPTHPTLVDTYWARMRLAAMVATNRVIVARSPNLNRLIYQVVVEKS